MTIALTVALFTLNLAIKGRLGVYEKLTVLDRERRGVTALPLFKFPAFEDGLAVYRRDNFTAPGKRLVPWAIASDVAFVGFIYYVTHR